MKKSKLKRIALWSLGGLIGLVAIVLLTVRLMYGGGDPYPDVSTEPLVPAARLQTLVETQFPPGNVTSAPDGRIFYNLHPFAEPGRYTDSFVFELVDGQSRPFPNLEFQPQLAGVLGMTVDRQQRLWMIRPAGIEDRPTRLFGFDLTTNELFMDHAFKAGIGPFAQDLRVSPDGETIYLADTGVFRFTPAALVVFDVETKTARRVLEDHPSVRPQDWVIRTSDGPYKVFYGLVTFSVGVDGVAVSHDGQWLYYATMSHDSVYRVRTQDLRDPSLSDQALGQRVEHVGSKPLSDGIEIDRDGTLYITDVENGGIARLSPDGQLATLVRNDDIVWADGITITPDHELLFTDSEIPAYIDQLLGSPERERIDRVAPHRIYRLPL